MAPLRLPALAVPLLLLSSLALPAHAGSAALPEVTDAANDQAAAGVVPISTQPPAGTTVGLNVDLLAGWVTETADALQFTVKVQGTGNPTSSSTTTWTFHFEIGSTAYDASATQEMASQQGTGQPGTGEIKPGGVATAATAAGDSLIVLTVPKLVVGSPAAGTALTNLFVSATGKTVGQASSVTDRAPDTGAGSNYVLTGGGAAKTTYGTLNGANVTVTHGFLNATTATYVYNWTQGPAAAAVRLTVQGSGNATVTVRDGANATLFRQSPRNTTAALDVTGQAGRWTITINYTGFKGDLSLTIAPPAAPPPTSSSTTPTTTGTGSATSPAPTPTGTGTTTTKGTPAAGAALLLAGLGAALLARRRRAA